MTAPIRGQLCAAWHFIVGQRKVNLKIIYNFDRDDDDDDDGAGYNEYQEHILGVKSAGA